MWKKRIAALATTAALATVGALSPTPASAGGQGEPLYGDLNGDGVTDRAALTVAGRDCTVTVYLGRRGGGYLPASTYPYLRPPGAMPQCPDLGVAIDLGGDRTTELVVGWFAGRPPTMTYDLLVLRNFKVATGFEALLQPSFIGLADFNGDRRMDVYEWTDQGDGFVTYLNTASGGLAPGPVKWCSGRPDFRLADFNGNGAMDVVIAYIEKCGGWATGVVVVLDNGLVKQLEDDADGAVTWTIGVSDVNADRILDVTATNQATGRPDHFIGKGDGNFVAATKAMPDKVTVSASRRTSIRVLANDYATSAAKVTIATAPAHGTATIASDRSVVYTPGRTPAASDRFVYRLAEHGRTSSAAVTLRLAAP